MNLFPGAKIQTEKEKNDPKEESFFDSLFCCFPKYTPSIDEKQTAEKKTQSMPIDVRKNQKKNMFTLW